MAESDRCLTGFGRRDSSVRSTTSGAHDVRRIGSTLFFPSAAGDSGGGRSGGRS